MRKVMSDFVVRLRLSFENKALYIKLSEKKLKQNNFYELGFFSVTGFW